MTADDSRRVDGAEMGEWFDRQGNPLTLLEWAKLLQQRGYKIVARDELPNGRLVSAVWLGLNHGFRSTPLIFETMVFAADESGELDMDRYPTEAEAKAGHEAMVAKWSTKQ